MKARFLNAVNKSIDETIDKNYRNFLKSQELKKMKEELFLYEKWYGETVRELEEVLELHCSTSDAQGMLDAQPFYLMQSWTKGLSAKETAKLISEKSLIQ